MIANKFFETEKLPEAIGFEKIPEGMTFIKTDTLDIETIPNKFDESKPRYRLKFQNKKGEKKSYEVGLSIIRGIEIALPKQTEYLILTRQGKTKDDTHYAVAAMEE